MFKQRRSFRSVFEGIVLRKKMKVINQSLESVIRNSYPYAPIGGGTIDDLVEYAKKKEIHWKFGFLSSMMVLQDSKIEFLESKLDELNELLDDWNEASQETLDEVNKLLNLNEDKDKRIEILTIGINSLKETLKISHKEIERLQEELNNQKSKQPININIIYSNPIFSNEKDSECELSESTHLASNLEDSNKRDPSPYERALNMIMECKGYFKANKVKKFTEEYGNLFNSHPEFHNKLNSKSFDKLVCQMIGAMVDEGFFIISDYHTIATVLDPNNSKTSYTYAKYMGMAKKDNAPYMIKEWKKNIRR